MSEAESRETGAILFDAAGTLFDLTPDLPARLVAAVAGQVADPDTVVQAALAGVNERGGWPEDQVDAVSRRAVWTDFVSSLLTDISPTGRFDRAGTAATIAVDICDPRSYRLFPESRQVLAACTGAGAPCAIVSNFDTLLLEIVDHLGIGAHFAAVTYSGAVGVYKPDPRLFTHALAQLGVDAAHAVMIGDSPYSDIGGARALGLRAILVDRERRCPDHDGEVVTSLAELPSLLLGAGRQRPGDESRAA